MTHAIQPSSTIAARWAIYLRISRTDDRLGVDRQLDICRLQLAAMGVAEDEVEVFDENNTSATKGLDVRPEYVRLMGAIESGRIAGIMVFLQDRAWRDTDELSAFLKTGVRLATSSTGELDLTDPDTYANVKHATVSAEREIRLVSKRVSAATKQRAQLGMTHGRAPFGWRREVEVVGGRVVRRWDVINEDEARVLRYAAEQLSKGVSLRSITATIQEGDYARPRAMTFGKGHTRGRTPGTESARRWSSAQLRTLLLRESNAGHRIHKGELLDGVVAEWPPIFDEVTFRRIKLLFADPSRRSNDRGSARRWLLTDLASCSVCPDGGRILVHTGGNRAGARPAYVCVGRPGSKGCFQRHDVGHVDEEIARLVAERIADPEYAKPDPAAAEKLDELYAEVDRQKERLAAAEDANAEETISLAALGKITASVRARIAECHEAATAIKPQTGERIQSGAWALMDLDNRRAALRQLFASIAFVPSKIHGKNPARRAAIGAELAVTYPELGQ